MRKKQSQTIGAVKVRHLSLASLAAAALTVSAAPAHAYTFNTSPDWDVELDTNVNYGIGFRADKRDQKIADSPVEQNNEYKFPNVGNVTSDRVEIAPDLAVTYKQNYGFDVSLDAYKDFAYGDSVKTHPGLFAPGIPYAALSSSPSGHYGQYTNFNYNQGIELENAYGFTNGSIDGFPVQVKVGRFVDYWGNALFSGFQAISYGQSPIDLIKAVAAPATELKELFIPRAQISLSTQLSSQISLGFQYQFQYEYDRFPEGGTYLGVVDAVFHGAQSLAGSLPRGNKDSQPPDDDGNFGIKAIWSPTFTNSTFGLYFRQFDDVAPYSPFEVNVQTPVPTYHLAYARHVHMFATSLDTNIGTVSASFEASIRQNTGLNSVPGGDPALDPGGTDGARGNTLNVIANGIYALTPSPLWQTGTVLGEVAWTNLLAVTHDPQLYDAKGYACAKGGLNAGNGQGDGCSTKNEVNVTVIFDPQWLQVLPGLDLDAPLTASAGLLGNGQTLALTGTGDQAGTVAYSVGINALYQQKWDAKLAYSAFSSPAGKTAQNGFGQPYYTTGDGFYEWNDKAQILLTLSRTF